MKNIKLSARFFVISLALQVCWSVAHVRADSGGDLIVPKGEIQGVVDGVIDNDSASLTYDGYIETGTFSNGLGNFEVQTYRSGAVEEIQFFLTIEDLDFNTGDEVRIFFDFGVAHDHAINAQDRGIVIKRSPLAVQRTNVNLFGPPTTVDTDLPIAQWSITDNGINWVAEVKINASDLNSNFIPNLSGLYIEVIDLDTAGTTTTTGVFPIGAVKLNVDSWANLKTRHPIDYDLVLDFSGSMLSTDGGTDSRWTRAKRAADLFVAALGLLRSDYFADRVAASQYSWSCSGSDVSGDTTGAVQGVASGTTFVSIPAACPLTIASPRPQVALMRT